MTDAQTLDSHGSTDASHGEEEHHGPSFKAYMIIFGVLCVCTSLSFISNEAYRWGLIGALTSLIIIMLVSIFKATLVAMFFMHLKWDWTKLYFLVFPVLILTVMIVIVLLPDMILAWHSQASE